MQHLPLRFLLAGLHQSPSGATPLPISLFHGDLFPKATKIMLRMHVPTGSRTESGSHFNPSHSWQKMERKDFWLLRVVLFHLCSVPPWALLPAKDHFPTYMRTGSCCWCFFLLFACLPSIHHIPLLQNPAFNSPSGNLGLAYKWPLSTGHALTFGSLPPLPWLKTSSTRGGPSTKRDPFYSPQPGRYHSSLNLSPAELRMLQRLPLPKVPGSPLFSTCSQGSQGTECSRMPAKAPTSASFQPDCPENSQVPEWPTILPTSNLPEIVKMPTFLQLEERGYSATQRKIKTIDNWMKCLKSFNGTAIF